MLLIGSVAGGHAKKLTIDGFSRWSPSPGVEEHQKTPSIAPSPGVVESLPTPSPGAIRCLTAPSPGVSPLIFLALVCDHVQAYWCSKLAIDGFSRWCPWDGTERGVKRGLIVPWGGTVKLLSVPWDGAIGRLSVPWDGLSTLIFQPPLSAPDFV